MAKTYRSFRGWVKANDGKDVEVKFYTFLNGEPYTRDEFISALQSEVARIEKETGKAPKMEIKGGFAHFSNGQFFALPGNPVKGVLKVRSNDYMVEEPGQSPLYGTYKDILKVQFIGDNAIKYYNNSMVEYCVK